jgi:hypothetical protein
VDHALERIERLNAFLQQTREEKDHLADDV